MLEIAVLVEPVAVRPCSSMCTSKSNLGWGGDKRTPSYGPPVHIAWALGNSSRTEKATTPVGEQAEAGQHRWGYTPIATTFQLDEAGRL
eukprot:8406874-Pyramimonas_sp.AAC.1